MRYKAVMSKSSGKNMLLEVASLSMRTVRKYLEPYAHRNSPKKFIQAQLMTCLVLRAYLKTTYRGIIEILETSDGLRQRMGIEQLPHYSTLKKLADRGDTLHLVDCMLLSVESLASLR
jgi:hypothetical protein